MTTQLPPLIVLHYDLTYGPNFILPFARILNTSGIGLMALKKDYLNCYVSQDIAERESSATSPNSVIYIFNFNNSTFILLFFFYNFAFGIGTEAHTELFFDTFIH